MRKSHLILAIAIISSFAFSISRIAMAEETASQLRTKGYAYQYDGDTDKAIEFYEKALSLEPSARLYNDLGVCYEEKGLYKKAEEYYLKAAKMKDDYPAVHTNLAIFYEDKGELTKAAYHWQKRLNLAGDGDRWAVTAKEHLKCLPKLKLEAPREAKKAAQTDSKVAKGAEKACKDMPPRVKLKKKEEICGNRGYIFKKEDYDAKRQQIKEKLIEKEVSGLAGRIE